MAQPLLPSPKAAAECSRAQSSAETAVSMAPRRASRMLTINPTRSARSKIDLSTVKRLGRALSDRNSPVAQVIEEMVEASAGELCGISGEASL